MSFLDKAKDLAETVKDKIEDAVDAVEDKIPGHEDAKAKVAELREKADEVLGGNDAAADTASASEST